MGGGGSTQISDTKAQKTLSSIAAQRFNLYQQYYVPFENQYMSDVFAMKSPSAFENVESFVTSVQQPEFQSARRNMQNQAFAMGADPTSGQYQGRAAQAQEAQAAGMGRGGAEALSGQVDRYYQGMQNIVAMGQGQASQTMTGLGDVAGLAQTRGRSIAQESMGNYTSTLGALGTGAGLGYGYLQGQSNKTSKT
tara:strand:+ start:459 stop:1040 length:582 start_codon:yes stop_codon:yes gene_type:complete